MPQLKAPLLSLGLLVTSFAAASPELLVSRRMLHNGPNCWSAALLGAGLLRHPRYVDNVEIEFWISSPFCRDEEEPVAGGLVLLQTPDNGNWQQRHAFFMLTENESFSKRDNSHSSAYKVTSFQEALTERSYEHSVVRYVSCESWEQMSGGASLKWKRLEKRLAALEEKISRYIQQESGSLPPRLERIWRFELKRLSRELRIASPNGDARETARWASLRARLPSLEWQIRELRDPD